MKNSLLRCFYHFLFSLTFIVLTPNLKAEPGKKPGLKVKATVKGVKQFSDFRIHPDNFLWTTRWDRSGSSLKITNVIYDIKSGQSRELPNLRELLPTEPEKPIYEKSKDLEYRTELAGLKLSGDYWNYTGSINGELVYYNPKSDTAGLIYESIHYKKSIEGNPVCVSGSESRFIEKYQRYYCDSEKKYLEEKEYILEIHIREYITLDVKNKKILSSTILPQDDPGEDYLFKAVGCDRDGKKFYYYYITKIKSHNIYLRGVDTQNGEFVLKKVIPLPVRKNTENTINTIDFRSPDFSKVVFWEYDELINEKTGSLVNPGPVLIVTDLETGEYYSLPAMVTMYGHVMDLQGKYLLVSSHQTGELVKYDLEQKKVILKMNVTKNIYKWVLDSGSGQLYGFTMNQIEVRNFEDLKLIKTIRYESIFPGVTRVDRLISAEEIFGTLDGSRMVIGIIKQVDTFAASDQEDGFYVLETGE